MSEQMLTALIVVSGAVLVFSLIGLGLALWRLTQVPETKPKWSPRYVARSRDVAAGWGVWDSKEKRFLSDPELRTIPLHRIQDEQLEQHVGGSEGAEARRPGEEVNDEL